MSLSALAGVGRFLAGDWYQMWAEANEDDGSLGIATSSFYGLLICIGSFICGIILILIDRYRE